MSAKKFMPRDEWLELYKHPLWQKKRLEILEYAEWQCQGCGARDITLHVHHCRYVKGKKPWQYPNGWLTAMCEKCHEKLHGKKAAPATAVVGNAASPSFPAIATPDNLKGIWLGVVAKVRLGRKLISAWVESGALHEMAGTTARIMFPPNQSFARDFLEEGHLDFLGECFSSICGRTISVETFIHDPASGLPPEEKATAKFGAIFDLLGKL